MVVSSSFQKLCDNRGTRGTQASPTTASNTSGTQRANDGGFSNTTPPRGDHQRSPAPKMTATTRPHRLAHQSVSPIACSTDGALPAAARSATAARMAGISQGAGNPAIPHKASAPRPATMAKGAAENKRSRVSMGKSPTITPTCHHPQRQFRIDPAPRLAAHAYQAYISAMPIPANLLENNRKWSERVRRADPGFFSTLSNQQSPRYLWIGCADSRVPANEIVGLLPGELFVHRNVANIVVHTDLNCLSVLQYAVDVLQVECVIVCGHYGCGGVTAALGDERHGLIDNWLRHIQDVATKYANELDTLEGTAHSDRLCELNVLEQVENISRTTIMQDAWARGQKTAVVGGIYSLQDGILRDLGIRKEG